MVTVDPRELLNDDDTDPTYAQRAALQGAVRHNGVKVE